MKTVDFSETIAASDMKVGRSRHLIEFINGMRVLKVKVISCPWPKVVYIQKKDRSPVKSLKYFV